MPAASSGNSASNLSRPWESPGRQGVPVASSGHSPVQRASSLPGGGPRAAAAGTSVGSPAKVGGVPRLALGGVEGISRSSSGATTPNAPPASWTSGGANGSFRANGHGTPGRAGAKGGMPAQDLSASSLPSPQSGSGGQRRMQSRALSPQGQASQSIQRSCSATAVASSASARKPLSARSVTSMSSGGTGSTRPTPSAGSQAGVFRRRTSDFRTKAEKAGFLRALRLPAETKRADVCILGGSVEGRLCAAEVCSRGETVLLVEPPNTGQRAAFEAALKASVLPAAAVGRIGWQQVREACAAQEDRLRQLGDHLLQQRRVTLLVGEARFLQPEIGEEQKRGLVSVAVRSDEGAITHLECRQAQIALGVPAPEPQLRTGMEHCILPEALPELTTNGRGGPQGMGLRRLVVIGEGGRAAEICALCEAAGTKPIWLLETGEPQLEVAAELSAGLVTAMRLRGSEVVTNFPVWRVQNEADGTFTVFAANGSTPISGVDAVVYAVDPHPIVPPVVPKGTNWVMHITSQGYNFVDANHHRSEKSGEGGSPGGQSSPTSSALAGGADSVLSSARQRGAGVEAAAPRMSGFTRSPSPAKVGFHMERLPAPPIRIDMIWSRPPLGTAGLSAAEARRTYRGEPQIRTSRHRVGGGSELTVSAVFVSQDGRDDRQALCVGASALGSGASALLLGLSAALQAGASREVIDTVLSAFPADVPPLDMCLPRPMP